MYVEKSHDAAIHNDIIINLNHRATNYFPLISKIVHSNRPRPIVTRPSIRVNVYVSREENNKAFSSSYLSPRISSRNCKGPSEWDSDDPTNGAQVEKSKFVKKHSRGKRRNDKGRRTKGGSLVDAGQLTNRGKRLHSFSSEGFEKITFKLASHR